MEKIKEQISGIIVYTATDLDSLAEQHENIRARVNEGLKKMKEAQILFSKNELSDIEKYAGILLANRYNEAHRDLRTKLRAEFVF